jgi:hypothetical protein
MKRSPILLLLLALVIPAYACGSDDDETSSGSASDASAATDADATDDDDEAAADEDDEQREPLEPEEARRQGNPEVFDRIAAATDCAVLQSELDAHEANAETRRSDGDERRASILEEYAAATEERMAELDCAAT